MTDSEGGTQEVVYDIQNLTGEGTGHRARSGGTGKERPRDRSLSSLQVVKARCERTRQEASGGQQGLSPSVGTQHPCIDVPTGGKVTEKVVSRGYLSHQRWPRHPV